MNWNKKSDSLPNRLQALGFEEVQFNGRTWRHPEDNRLIITISRETVRHHPQQHSGRQVLIRLFDSQRTVLHETERMSEMVTYLEGVNAQA